MNQDQLIAKRNIAEVGELISYELAGKMIKDFNDANPTEIYCFTVGRNVIDQVLAQPGSVGLRLYRAINEEGKTTIVYAGVDADGKTILNYPGIDETGKLVHVKGLIGDKDNPSRFWFD